MNVFTQGDLGCETIKNTSAANCWRLWYAENAGGKATIESYVYSGRVYPYNGGHPKHPMKFSTHENGTLPRSSINK